MNQLNNNFHLMGVIDGGIILEVKLITFWKFSGPNKSRRHCTHRFTWKISSIQLLLSSTTKASVTHKAAAAMELCVNFPKILKLNQKTHLFFQGNSFPDSIRNPTIQFIKIKNQKNPLNFPQRLSSLSRQIQFLQPPTFPSGSRLLAASMASEVVTNQFPADIEVTETQEPNSRVRFSSSFHLI